MKVRMFLVFLGSLLQLAAQQGPALLGTLPEAVAESSGLIYYKGVLITHNDSGNEPVLYEVDTTTLQIVRSVRILNATNSDWEDIAQDDQYIYVGDTGNVNGTRQDLKVYRVAKADYDAGDSVSADIISYSYEDQADFTRIQQSDWDAEALLATEGRLMVFTKQWKQYGTVAYTFPATPGTHSARRAGSFHSNGLITGAAFSKNSGTAFLCGYDLVLQPFLIRLDAFSVDAPFAGSPLKTKLEIGLGQVEAIAYAYGSRYFFSTEKFVNTMPPLSLMASLFAFEDKPAESEMPPQETPPGNEVPDPGDTGENGLLIITPFGSRDVEYRLNRTEPVYGRAIFDIHGRRVQYTHANDIDSAVLDLSALGSSVYYLVFFLEGKTLAKPFFLN